MTETGYRATAETTPRQHVFQTSTPPRLSRNALVFTLHAMTLIGLASVSTASFASETQSDCAGMYPQKYQDTVIPIHSRFGHVGFPSEVVPAVGQRPTAPLCQSAVMFTADTRITTDERKEQTQTQTPRWGHSIGQLLISEPKSHTQESMGTPAETPVKLLAPSQTQTYEQDMPQPVADGEEPTDDEKIVSKPLNQLRTEIAVDGEIPPNRARRQIDDASAQCSLCSGQRGWGDAQCRWQATQLKYHHLYFEDAELERNGIQMPLIQPAVSGARFCADVGLLPYRLLVESPRERQYSLGNYRPGSAAPPFWTRVPSP
jgi:hypothetical protein